MMSGIHGRSLSPLRWLRWVKWETLLPSGVGIESDSCKHLAEGKMPKFGWVSAYFTH